MNFYICTKIPHNPRIISVFDVIKVRGSERNEFAQFSVCIECVSACVGEVDLK